MFPGGNKFANGKTPAAVDLSNLYLMTRAERERGNLPNELLEIAMTVEDDINFSGFVFPSRVSFKGTQFYGRASFVHAEFVDKDDDALFDEAKFHGEAYFNAAKFHAAIRFERTRI